MRRTTTETALNHSGFIEDAVTVPEENGEGVKNQISLKRTHPESR